MSKDICFCKTNQINDVQCTINQFLIANSFLLDKITNFRRLDKNYRQNTALKKMKPNRNSDRRSRYSQMT